MSTKLIIVVGSGPGIGSTTAAHFASKGFNVALLARNADRLKEDASRVSKAAGNPDVQIKTYSVDAGNHKDVRATLDQVKNDLGPPEVVLFNAARVAPSEYLDTAPERLSEDFQVMNVGLFVTASWAVPHLESVKKQRPDSHPSFLITGGGIARYPDAQFMALSMQKAAQVNFAGSLDQIAGSRGIHVATVSVNGVVEDSNPVINAKNIASRFWDLHMQDKESWESMVDVGDLPPS